MNDKFVVSTNEIGEIIVTDVETDRVYRYGDISKFFGLIRLLNEQQSIIDEQKIAIDEMITDYKNLKKENGELRKELDDCEKFRYQVFKRLNDEHIKERSIK